MERSQRSIVVPGTGSGDGGDELVDGLVQLSFVVQTVLGRLADGHGLTTTSVRMLAVLEDREIGMQQLAAILELEKSSVTGLVDRAERRGLVQRRAVPGDRRAVRVTVTSDGRELVRAARKQISSEIACMAGVLGPRQQEHLRRLVLAVTSHYVDTHAIPL